MEKPRQTSEDVGKEVPVAPAVSKWGSEPLVTIDGATFVLQPVEDLTKTMSPERVEQFIRNYKAAEDPANRFNEKQAMELFRQRRRESRNG